MIRVELEPRPSGRTAVILAGEQLAIGRGSVVCQAARVLLGRGADPDDRLEAYRGTTLCLSGRLSRFAELTVKEGERPPRFVAWSVPLGSGIDDND